jgi:thioredoxin 1
MTATPSGLFGYFAKNIAASQVQFGASPNASSCLDNSGNIGNIAKYRITREGPNMKWMLLVLVFFWPLAGCAKPAAKDAIQSRPGGAQAKVTFIELGSVNCIPCMKMQLVMKEIEREYTEQVAVVFYDVWTEAGKPYAQQYRIRVIPTQVFLDQEGNEYFRHEGYFPKQELIQVLRQKGVR